MPARQYWDDAKALGKEFKERFVPRYGGKIAWDVWVLFDEKATWDTAGEHVVAWGSTVVATEAELVAQLERFTARRRDG